MINIVNFILLKNYKIHLIYIFTLAKTYQKRKKLPLQSIEQMKFKIYKIDEHKVYTKSTIGKIGSYNKINE